MGWAYLTFTPGEDPTREGTLVSENGKLPALAVTSARRATALPEIPTVAESGVPGYEAASWAGIVVPKATPAPVVDESRKPRPTLLPGQSLCDHCSAKCCKYFAWPIERPSERPVARQSTQATE